MFTGIIEELGKVTAIQKGGKSSVLTISGNMIFQDLKLGHSVATNGVCLTVKKLSNNSFTADVMNETLMRSSLGDLSIGDYVNLERAMIANGRFGGHIVSGHIDGTGTIKTITADDNATWYEIATDTKVMKYIVEKGSIAIDGVSLTVARTNLKGRTFSVSIIPHTMSETVLSKKKTGDVVNLENDIVGKYIERFTELKNKQDVKKSNITEETLIRAGF